MYIYVYIHVNIQIYIYIHMHICIYLYNIYTLSKYACKCNRGIGATSPTVSRRAYITRAVVSRRSLSVASVTQPGWLHSKENLFKEISENAVKVAGRGKGKSVQGLRKRANRSVRLKKFGAWWTVRLLRAANSSCLRLLLLAHIYFEHDEIQRVRKYSFLESRGIRAAEKPLTSFCHGSNSRRV